MTEVCPPAAVDERNPIRKTFADCCASEPPGRRPGQAAAPLRSDRNCRRLIQHSTPAQERSETLSILNAHCIAIRAHWRGQLRVNFGCRSVPTDAPTHFGCTTDSRPG